LEKNVMRYIKAELVTPAYSYTVRYVTEFFTGAVFHIPAPVKKTARSKQSNDKKWLRINNPKKPDG
jgi:hypothetical protein